MKPDKILHLRNQVQCLRDTYTGGSHQFAALHLAWEALQFAWYVANSEYDTAAEKLELVKRAVEDCDW